MNRDLASPIATEKEIPMPPLNETVDQATETAFANRQEIRVTQLQLDSANKGITIARAGYFPSLAATAAYDKIGEQPDVDFLDSGRWASVPPGISSGGFTADVSRPRLTGTGSHRLQAQKNRGPRGEERLPRCRRPARIAVASSHRLSAGNVDPERPVQPPGIHDYGRSTRVSLPGPDEPSLPGWLARFMAAPRARTSKQMPPWAGEAALVNT